MTFCRPTPAPIEDYAIIGDCRSAALVAKDGSIDWLCWPRFDSAACFAALLGGPEHGRYHIGPAAGGACRSRRYQKGTLILETLFETDQGQAVLIDFMVPERRTVLLSGSSKAGPARSTCASNWRCGSTTANPCPG